MKFTLLLDYTLLSLYINPLLQSVIRLKLASGIPPTESHTLIAGL